MAGIWWLALLPVATIRTDAGSRDPGSPGTGTIIGHVTGRLIWGSPHVSGTGQYSSARVALVKRTSLGVLGGTRSRENVLR
jgi:hypothetical protein